MRTVTSSRKGDGDGTSGGDGRLPIRSSALQEPQDRGSITAPLCSSSSSDHRTHDDEGKLPGRRQGDGGVSMTKKEVKNEEEGKDEEEGDLTAASKDPSGRSEPSCQPTVAVASRVEVRDRLKRDDARKRQDLLKKVKAKKQVFAEDQCIPRAPPETSPLKLTIKLGSCTADKKVTAAAADRRNTADPLAAVVVKPAVGQPSSSLGSVSGKVVPTGINY